MVRTTIEIIALYWLGYNAWRVFSSSHNAIQVIADVEAKCPREYAFNTYMKVREYYIRLSPGHKKYEISGTDLLKDGVIDVWETAGFQYVKHRYRVSELTPNEKMALVSEISQIKVFGIFKSQSRSEVEFRFCSTTSGDTKLGLTIRIVFPNRFRHLLARVFFTEAIWRAHAREEMNALARIIEQHYAIEND
ncbi:MAG TPA: hypothetical protein DDY20_07760 [Desulfobulbaceae bacterium]|nr:hypothetical protein [Desulfobulbaceae bacterium]